MADTLTNLKNEFEESLNVFEHNMVKAEALIVKKGPNDDSQQIVDENVSSLSKKCATLEKAILSHGSKEQFKQYIDVFRKKTFKWFMKSRCIRRSFEKPQGYAGDFEVIDWIYQNKPEGEGIGFALDKYFLENKGSQAMRSRKKFLVEKLAPILRSLISNKAQGSSIFDLGCGPGRDILELFDITGPVKTILMDQDKDALNYSRKLLSPYLQNIEFVQHNLLRVIAGEKYVAKKFGLHDVVMCIGLYDYLDEDASVKLLRSSYNLLKDKSTLIISNWNVTNPSRTELEWVCDWHLYHRTASEMVRIIERAGIPSSEANLEYDPTGHFHMVFINKS